MNEALSDALGGVQFFNLMMGDKVKITKRSVYTIIDALTTIGGFSGTIFMACSFIISWY